jgi:hypothetical protein
MLENVSDGQKKRVCPITISNWWCSTVDTLEQLIGFITITSRSDLSASNMCTDTMCVCLLEEEGRVDIRLHL